MGPGILHRGPAPAPVLIAPTVCLMTWRGESQVHVYRNNRDQPDGDYKSILNEVELDSIFNADKLSLLTVVIEMNILTIGYSSNAESFAPGFTYFVVHKGYEAWTSG